MRPLNQIIATFIALASLSTGSALAGNAYQVTSEITERGIAVANPVLVVNGGAPASISITGDKGYRLTVQVDPSEGGAVDVTARAETAVGKVDSTLTGELGKPMTVAIGDIGLKITVTSVDG